MINVGLLFIFVAGVAFLGFIISALFNRIRITKILPLMLIGLIAGPVLHLVNTGANSTLENIVPVVSALAISFILFDVGLNINIFRLGKVIKKASAFTFAIALSTGMILAAAAYSIFGWTIAEALIFGFALSGPSSIIVPTLMKSLRVTQELNDTMIYESVATDALSLVIPILLLQFMLTSNVTISGAATLFIVSIFGAVILGIVLAIFWLYILKSFEDYSKKYGWMLTITIVLATYGIATLLNLSTAIAVFTFGIMFSNLGMITFKLQRPSDTAKVSVMGQVVGVFVMQHLHLGNGIKYIKEYQREVGFFTSTFFFVYIGLLFNAENLSTVMIGMAVVMSVMMVLVRIIFLPVIKEYEPNETTEKKTTERVVSFNVARGLSPAIVATLPLAAGIIIPNFLNEIFLVILISNILSTIGILVFYKIPKEKGADTRNRQASRHVGTVG